MRKIAIGVATAVLLAFVALAQDDMAVLNFVVIRDYSGKPIRNASVVMHPVEKNGKQSKGGLQIKPIRTARPVLTACLTASCESRCWPRFPDFWQRLRHRQTINGDHGQDEAAVGQYSIYEDHPEEKKDQRSRRSSRTKIRKRSRSRVADFRC